ncbi:helix-turn-helix domain-containing protein [Pseudoclavibacter sp. RFBA6]|uniref:helix-turn-helix domain-containing protein n=1 Tax=Pseudoclavibacter sp. RFBA6 TaxID=2080573 RepID=UPI002157E520|nr:helix-turn-helix domain-containing protein [Pseudoclavibacter sp. RFBA6]
MAHLSDRQKAELVRQHQDGVPWTRLAEHAGVAVRTLQRWATRMETGQLARAPRAIRDRRALPPNWLQQSRRLLCAGQHRRSRISTVASVTLLGIADCRPRDTPRSARSSARSTRV